MTKIIPRSLSAGEKLELNRFCNCVKEGYRYAYASCGAATNTKAKNDTCLSNDLYKGRSRSQVAHRYALALWLKDTPEAGITQRIQLIEGAGK